MDLCHSLLKLSEWFIQNSIKNSESDIFRVTEGAIKRPEFLGKQINNMCSGVSIYWLSPSCSGNGTEAEKHVSEGWSTEPFIDQYLLILQVLHKDIYCIHLSNK